MSVPAPLDRQPAQPAPARERQRGISLGPEHTRVPNLLLDLVYPRLGPAPQACLLYIARKTYGFSSPTVSGQRKKWDRISLSQFISGSSAADVVMDLGTGLASRSAVIRGLRELETLDLVKVSYECPTTLQKGRTVGCGWNEADDDHLTRPVIDPKTKAYKCPRCSRTLSKAYSLRTLTPGWIKRFLTATDPDKREWVYDPEISRFRRLAADNEEIATTRESELQANQRRAAELREQLWFPELVDQIIGQAITRLKSGKMAETRVINGFLAPIVEMQSTFTRNALKHGLSEAARRKVTAGPGQDTRWQNYVKVVAKSYSEKMAGGKQEAEKASAQAGIEADLQQCAALNREGRREQARQLLHDLLSTHLDQVTQEFAGDRALARRHVVEAFKRGLDDYLYVRDYTVTVDYLPDWTWESDEARTA
jgi:hypothetical protein